MCRKTRATLLFLTLILFCGVFSLARITNVNAQACSAPAPATGVTVEYPGCNGSDCEFTQASCSWNAQATASSFHITVTELETGTIIKNNESVSSATTKTIFPITQGRTYKCDVVSVSSCGGLAAASSDQLLCEADALIDAPAPTTAAPPPNSSNPQPPMASPGGILQTITIVGGVAIVLFGGLFLLAF